MMRSPAQIDSVVKRKIRDSRFKYLGGTIREADCRVFIDRNGYPIAVAFNDCVWDCWREF